tara:strand:+ start:1797 stop:2033 length:237 start_codon:yes stop_codon:yes gene_type:complete
MLFILKKSLFTLIFNFSLFLVLMIGIQNSHSKKKVNLIIGETVNLPIGFIVGISFIGGSITASLLETNNREKEIKKDL